MNAVFSGRHSHWESFILHLVFGQHLFGVRPLQTWPSGIQ
jgi:hypothetical protein